MLKDDACDCPQNKEIEPVLDEITAVLKKHDMVGIVMVGSRTHVDYRMNIEATWSCAWMEPCPEGIALRIRSKLSEYPDKAAQKKTLEETVGTFVTFTDVLKRIEEGLVRILVLCAKHMEIHGKSNFEGE